MEKLCKIEGCNLPKLSDSRSCKKHRQEQKNEAVKRLQLRSPERFKSYTLTRDYGITLNDYIRLSALQDNKCAICGCDSGSERSNNNGSKLLSVDHNHKTGKIRGLLCGACNKGIGCLLDDPNLLRKAATYLDLFDTD